MSTKILNVDDHHVNRYLRTQVLEAAGYSVIEAATGAEALARYAADRPQMVLLDVNLPDMSGFEVCRLIKDMPDGMTTVVVHISATAIAIEQQTEGLEGGADGYLAEPVEPDFLVAQVRSLLRLQRAEERLRRSEERFRSVFAEAPIGMTVFGPDLRLQQVNATFCRLFGYEESDLIGIEFPRLVHPEDEVTQRQQLDALFTDGLERYQKETQYRTKRGDSISTNLTVSLVRDLKDHSLYAIGLIEDITHRKKMEGALRKSNEELNQFAYAASHDLQEPLRTVSTQTQLLAKKYKGKLDARADELIGYVVEGANRMQVLIQDLLTLSQVQGLDEVTAQPVDMNAALQLAIKNLETALNESGAELTTSDITATVLADPAQMCQIFQNLISNAIKYRSGEQLRIHVAATSQSDEWIFSVTDNGLGFDQKHASFVFGVFKRLHDRKIPGTGIGLALCKKIVERHGGQIWAESTPGKGSTFYFSLPVIRDGTADFSA